jgi:hypothetical protein
MCHQIIGFGTEFPVARVHVISRPRIARSPRPSIRRSARSRTRVRRRNPRSRHGHDRRLLVRHRVRLTRSERRNLAGLERPLRSTNISEGKNHAIPNARLLPATEPRVDRLPRPESLGQIAPRETRRQVPEDPVEDSAVVLRGSPRRRFLGREQHPHLFPLRVGQYVGFHPASIPALVFASSIRNARTPNVVHATPLRPHLFANNAAICDGAACNSRSPGRHQR